MKSGWMWASGFRAREEVDGHLGIFNFQSNGRLNTWIKPAFNP